MADTDIVLKVALDTKDVGTRSKQLQNEIKRIFEATSGKQLNSQLSSIETRMAKASNEATKLQTRLKELENTKVPTAEYTEVKNQIDETTKEFDKLLEKQEEMQRKGKDSGPVWDDLQYKMDEAAHTIEYAKGELQDLIDTGKAFTLGSNSEEYKVTEMKLRDVNNQMAVLTTQAYKAEPALKKSFSGVRTTLSSVKDGIKKAAGAVGQFAKVVGGKALIGIKKLGTSIKQAFITKPIEKARMGIGNLIKSMLGAASIYAIFRKLFGAIKEGINNLARWNNGNNEVNASLSMLMSSLTQLKNSIGAAFAPILTAVAPILNKFIQLLIQAANAVGAFFSAITGHGTMIKATKVNQNYAKSLGGVGGAAKKAAGELGKYDELVVIGQENSGGGGGGGGLDPNDMFEEVPIDSSILDFVNKMKEAWEKADFTEIGRIVGEKLKASLDNASDFLVNVAQPFAFKIGKSIATFLNGFFETPGLATSLGTTIGEMLNTALALATGFLQNFHFESFGKFIGETITGLFSTVHWVELGQDIALLGNGVFQLIQGFADGYDAVTVAQSLADALNSFTTNFDWAGNAQAISAFFKDIVDTVSNFLADVDWSAIGEGIATFFQNIDWVGLTGSLWTGLSNLVVAALDLLNGFLETMDWTALVHTSFEMILTAFQSVDWSSLMSGLAELLGAAIGAAFGLIEGLAEVIYDAIDAAWKSVVDWWYEQVLQDGEFTIGGLLQGILNGMASIGNWILDNIFKPFIDGFKSAFGISSPSKVMEEQGDFIVEGVLIPLKEMPAKVLAFFIELKDKIKSKVDEIKQDMETKWTEIKTNISTKVIEIKTDLEAKWNEIKTNLTNKITEIKTGLVNGWTEAKTNVTQVITDMKNSVISIFEGLWSGIKKPINSVLAGVEKFANGVIDGMNKMIKAVNGLKFTVPGWVPIVGGKSLGFTIPSLSHIGIPKLAQGAVIPPNKEFMAVLGDQKQGTNIETPLETMVQAFKQAMAEFMQEGNISSGNMAPIVLQLDGRTVAETVWDESLKRYKQTGKRPY